MTTSSKANGQVTLSDDEKSLQALCKWLDIQNDSEAQRVIQETLKNDPLIFLKTHVDSLPSNILHSLIAHRTTPVQRGGIPTITSRRRVYAQLHEPEELTLANSRKRLRVLWTRFCSRGAVPADGEDEDTGALDPPFPNIPSNDIPVRFTQQARRRQYGPPHTGELFDHPRLRRLMRDQDREEEQEQAEEEESDVEDEEEPDDEDSAAVDAFKIAILERFVKGDPTLSPSLYAQVDYDESLDNERHFDRTANTTASHAHQATRERAQMDEDAYFDDE